MAKAMLIMDMPRACYICPFHYKAELMAQGNYMYKQLFRCGMQPKDVEDVYLDDVMNKKPTWCPLREVPSKHEDGHTLKVAIENDCYDDTVQDDAYFEGIDKGYNRCIDEILGGAEHGNEII